MGVLMMYNKTLKQWLKLRKVHTVKVIIETVLLDHDEIVKASELTKAPGADFVKTSTGFAGGGATAEDVKINERYSRC